MSEGYRHVGGGEHVVFGLHGWFGSAEAWSALEPHLDRDAFTYVFLNCRGYGSRRDVAGKYSPAEVAADVLELADSWGATRFSLLGHSMGGKFMQQVCAEAPDRVRAMVGVSPVPAGQVPFDDDGWALFSGAAERPENRRAIIDLTTGNRHTDVWLDAMVRHSLDHSDPDAFGAYLHAWARADFHERIVGSTVPVKAIAGEHDPALGEAVMRGTFEVWYPNAEIEVMGNAGHYALDETPVALATSVEAFLKRH